MPQTETAQNFNYNCTF